MNENEKTLCKLTEKNANKCKIAKKKQKIKIIYYLNSSVPEWYIVFKYIHILGVIIILNKCENLNEKNEWKPLRIITIFLFYPVYNLIKLPIVQHEYIIVHLKGGSTLRAYFSNRLRVKTETFIWKIMEFKF